MEIRQALENIRNVSPALAEKEIVCIRANREEAVPVLLEYVKKAADEKDKKPWEYDAHFYSMYLLAEFQIKEAFPHLIQYLEFDPDFTNYLLGDCLTEDFSSILASVATGDDIPRLKTVIENTNLYTLNRSAALGVLLVLFLQDVYDRDDYVKYLQHLLETCHDDPTFLAFIVCACEHVGFRDLLPAIERVFDAKLVDEQVTDLPFVRDMMMLSNEASSKEGLQKYERNMFVQDTIGKLKTWYCFSEKYLNDTSVDNNEVSASNWQGEADSGWDDFAQYVSDNAPLISLKFLAEEREPEYTLNDMLAAKKVAVLRKMGSYYKVANCSRKKKAEIVPLLAEKMLDVDTLKGILTILGSTEWDFFKKAASVKHLIDEKTSARDIISLYVLGIMSVYYFYSHFYFIVPAEIRQVFSQLEEEGFPADKEFSDLLNEYALAAVNLYGVITQDDFVELFNSQNDRKTDIDEMFETLTRFVYMDDNYVFWDNYIVSHEFEEGDYKDVELYAKIASAKPRYLPEREKLLKHSDSGYIEKTPQFYKLRAYLSKSIINDEVLADEIVEDFYFFAAREARPHEYIELLEEHDISLSADKTKALMSLVFDLANNVRSWLNNGHTPSELAARDGRHLTPRTNEPIRVIKIGRNEPCPCESGKKYKKCCGM